MQLIDLSHPITSDMLLWSEDWPKPQINVIMSHADSVNTGRYQDCTCEIHHVSFMAASGTKLDAPFHFMPDGATIDRITLEQCILPGVTVDARGYEAGQWVDDGLFEGLDFNGKAVLVNTGWSQYWGMEKYKTYPVISETTIQRLIDGGAKLVGVDTETVDDSSNPRRPAHTGFLYNDILIAENLKQLDRLHGHEFIFHAAPIMMQGASSMPVRAYAVLM